LLLTPTAALRDGRGELKLAGVLGEKPVIGESFTSGNNEESPSYSQQCLELSKTKKLKCELNAVLWRGLDDM